MGVDSVMKAASLVLSGDASFEVRWYLAFADYSTFSTPSPDAAKNYEELTETGGNFTFSVLILWIELLSSLG